MVQNSETRTLKLSRSAISKRLDCFLFNKDLILNHLVPFLLPCNFYHGYTNGTLLFITVENTMISNVTQQHIQQS